MHSPSRLSSSVSTLIFLLSLIHIFLLCALLVAILPPLTGLGGWNHWIYTALVFVVSACPCALVISIPLGFYAGIGAASKRGVLIKGGKHIENLAKLTDAVFDKTGTLTDGKLQVTEVKALADLGEGEVLAYSALAEQYSNHPISRSIVAQCPQLPGEKLLSVEEIAGKGVRAQLEGRELLCGSARLLRDAGVVVPEGIEANVLLAIGGQCKGYVAVGDQVRPDSRETMSQLKACLLYTSRTNSCQHLFPRQTPGGPASPPSAAGAGPRQSPFPPPGARRSA